MGRGLGEVLATREFTAAGPAGPLRVVVRIGQPYRRRTGEWACPFRVNGGGRQRLKWALGVDAFQALQLVFQGIRVELQSKPYTVTWEGTGLDTVLPRPLPAFGDEAFTARIIRMVDREMLRYHRAFRARLAKMPGSKARASALKACDRAERGLDSSRNHRRHRDRLSRADRGRKLLERDFSR